MVLAYFFPSGWVREGTTKVTYFCTCSNKEKVTTESGSFDCYLYSSKMIGDSLAFNRHWTVL